LSEFLEIETLLDQLNDIFQGTLLVALMRLFRKTLTKHLTPNPALPYLAPAESSSGLKRGSHFASSMIERVIEEKRVVTPASLIYYERQCKK